jgi:hypothetical protein
MKRLYPPRRHAHLGVPEIVGLLGPYRLRDDLLILRGGFGLEHRLCKSCIRESVESVRKYVRGR